MSRVIETRICKVSGLPFDITEDDARFYEKISPNIGGKVYPMPFPTLSPVERRRRRLSYKNFFSLHKRTSSKSGKPIISIYPKESPYIVFGQDEWCSDQWNPLDYGREIDFNRSFFEQLNELHLIVPQLALENSYLELENSDYVNGNGQAKDCYLISNSANNERCLYGYFLWSTKDILDSNSVVECESCSHSDHIYKCYNLHYAFNSDECRHSRYIFSCRGSHHLLGCVDISNGNYQILNTSCTPEEYEATLDKLKNDPLFRRAFEGKVQDLIRKVGIEQSITLGSENCIGDFLYDSKDTKYSYNVGNAENCAFLVDSMHSKDSYDIDGWGENTNLSYDSVAVGQNINNVYWNYGTYSGASYVFHSWNCLYSSYCFGCFGLQHKKYCIFNKQYTKEEWEVLVGKLIEHMMKIGEWGEFMDARYSPFAYNECHAGLVLPLSQEEVEKRGLRWIEREEKMEGIERTIPAHLLPEIIQGIPDDILSWVILCERTGKPFRITQLELEFYRKHGLPIPRKHPIERIKDRFEWDKRNFIFD